MCDPDFCFTFKGHAEGGDVDPPSGRYELVTELGVGGFSVVYLARHILTGQAYAIKFVAIKSLCRRTINEAANHWNLRHPHVVEVKEVFTTPDALGFVMEYCPGGNLFTYLRDRKRLNEDAARWIFQQLIYAVDYVHRAGVANRDIKLENILLDGGPRPLIKLCDFGLSKHKEFESRPQSRVGTTNHLSPEMIKEEEPYDGQCADVWACGVVLYTMLVGHYPFQPSEGTKDYLKVLLQRIAAVDYAIPSALSLSTDLTSLLSQILVSDPRKRATLSEIQQHPWFCAHLPQEARDMNDNCLRGLNIQGTKQRRQDIKEVLSILKSTNSEAFNSRNSDELLDMRVLENAASWLML